ncbi:DotA/TraY family protein [Asaia sp. As-1742]|nr:DotA/TraY family protein [Asaia sp. As-1742]
MRKGKSAMIGPLAVLMLLVLGVAPALAQDSTAATAATPTWNYDTSDDWTIWALHTLSPIGAGASTVTGTMYQIINVLVAGLGSIYALYALMLKGHEVSETGEILANKFNGMVVPRYVLASAMLIPAPGLNGLSPGQVVFVDGIGVGSINAARMLNNAIIDAIGPRALPIADPIVPNTRTVVQGVIANEMCRGLINAFTNNNQSVPEPVYKSDSYGIKLDYGLPDVCGSVFVSHANASSQGTFLSFPDISNDQIAAFKTLVTNVRAKVVPIAQAMYTTHSAAPLTGLNAILMDEANTYNNALVNASVTAIAAMRNTANGGREDPGIAEMHRLGWSGAAAYYLEIARLNSQVLGASSITPTVTAPSYYMLGSYLAEDLKPYIEALETYQAEQDASLTLLDTSKVPGQAPELEAGADQDAPSALSSPFDWALRKLHINEYFTTTVMSLVAAPAAGSGWTDPTASIIHMGHFLIHSSFATMGLLALSESDAVHQSGAKKLFNVAKNAVTGNEVGAALSALNFVGGGLLSHLAPAIMSALLALLIPGLILAYLLPMMPFMYFFAGVMGWFIILIEAVIALPIGAIAHLVLGGEGLHGKGIRVYEMAFHILLRPILMLAGLMMSYTLFSLGSWFLMKGMAICAGFVLANGYLLDNLLGDIVIIAVFVSGEMALANLCFRLISTIPHHATAMAGFASIGRVDSDSWVSDTTGKHSQGKALEETRKLAQTAMSERK